MDQDTQDEMGWSHGHILRADDKRLIKKTLHHIFDQPQEGDILMDTDAEDWTQLQKQASDREVWRKRVKQIAASSTRTWQNLRRDVTTMLRKRRAIKVRFHIRRQALQRKFPSVKRKAKNLSDVQARDIFYKKHEEKYKACSAKANFFKTAPQQISSVSRRTSKLGHVSIHTSYVCSSIVALEKKAAAPFPPVGYDRIHP